LLKDYEYKQKTDHAACLSLVSG